METFHHCNIYTLNYQKILFTFACFIYFYYYYSIFEANNEIFFSFVKIGRREAEEKEWIYWFSLDLTLNSYFFYVMNNNSGQVFLNYGKIFPENSLWIDQTYWPKKERKKIMFFFRQFSWLKIIIFFIERNFPRNFPGKNFQRKKK